MVPYLDVADCLCLLACLRDSLVVTIRLPQYSNCYSLVAREWATAAHTVQYSSSITLHRRRLPCPTSIILGAKQARKQPRRHNKKTDARARTPRTQTARIRIYIAVVAVVCREWFCSRTIRTAAANLA